MDNRDPHVVILPFPAQGHIKPMLMLAELLSQAGLAISFVNTEHSHRRLLDGAAFRRRCPGINFLTIPDGLPPDHPRSGPGIVDLLLSTSTACEPNFKDLIASMSHAPACIISDGIMSFAVDVAAELGIPAIAFRTYSATATWTYFHLEKLMEEIPVVANAESEELERRVRCVPGLEDILRQRDFPQLCSLGPRSPIMQFYITQAAKMRNASALILNTFHHLEAPMLSRLRSIFPAVYAVGPLRSPASSTSTSLLQMDQSCIHWLDSQPPGSVLYVSFGSVAVLTPDHLMEFWHGLVNSGSPFLWAIRPDLIRDADSLATLPVPEEMRTSERGRIVGWAPQEEVLAHDAVGGFLTHCGWNSILESVWAGKPMICRPLVAEQQVNGRCASEMWGLGFDLNCVCDRSTVERVVRDLMEGSGKQGILRSTAEMARLARDSVRDGGSSHTSLNSLVADIKMLHAKAQNSPSN
ncbi:7-deoxyloganetic acid glucosyl transferase-like [Salvia miltiorrhiza]|uniref:7-deoxyloganetic acid glucosyl transferase-like n=1 Tax=Salvia miltiorrhiza TaxID=226208 RepID=UPI0025AC4860|nr:7-deoxyloganetic acid glucosyl transferase-like [Salvia miltiorrhiza]